MLLYSPCIFHFECFTQYKFYPLKNTHTDMSLSAYLEKHNFQSVFSIWGWENSFPETGLIGPFHGEVAEVNAVTRTRPSELRLDPRIL